MVAMSNDYPGLNFSKPSLSGPTWKVDFFLKSPISIVQRAYIPKNGVEFRQHTNTNSDNKTGVATSREVVRYSYTSTVVTIRLQAKFYPIFWYVRPLYDENWRFQVEGDPL